MQHYRPDPQRIGDLAGVLATRAAKTAQQEFRNIVSALDADFLDRIGHSLDRDPQESRADCLHRLLMPGGHGDLVAQRGETLAHDVYVEWQIGVRTEYSREETRLNTSQ
jgi:hypothetical protein